MCALTLSGTHPTLHNGPVLCKLHWVHLCHFVVVMEISPAKFHRYGWLLYQLSLTLLSRP
jgi:hypothetical protein